MAYPQNHDSDLDIGDEDTSPDSHRVAVAELRGFVERIERLEAEIGEIQGQRKEVYAEAKSRGYDVAALRKVISDRKKDAEKLSELEAIIELYRSTLGIL